MSILNWIFGKNKLARTRKSEASRRKFMGQAVERLEDRSMMAAVFTEDFSSYNGTGLTPGTVAGSLNTNSWSANLNGTAVAFGGTNTTASPFAQGSFLSGSSNTGLNSTAPSNGNKILAIQPTGSVFNSATETLILRVLNDSNSASNVTASYDIWVNNNGPRSNTLNFAYSTDGTTYNTVAGAQYTSTATVDANGLVFVGTKQALTNTSIAVSANSYIYFKWWGLDTASPTGARDLFGLDNINVALTAAADVTGPTVTVNQSATQADPTSSNNVLFDVNFSENILAGTFTASDISLGGTATGASVVAILGSNPNYQIVVSGMTGSGTIIPTIAANAVQDAFGNNSAASSSTDNSVTYNYSAPGTSISYTTQNASYNQDFNGLPTVLGKQTSLSTAFALTSAPIYSTSPSVDGWYAGYSGGYSFAADNGGASTGSSYSFGSVGSTDRALGGSSSGSYAPNFGAILTNNSGVTLNNFAISYIEEQWKQNSVASQTIAFQYKVGGTNIDDASGWTSLTSLDLTTIATNASLKQVDGNSSSNQLAKSGNVASGLNWTNGSKLVVRWFLSATAGSGQGLAVDNFQFTAGTSNGAPTVTTNTGLSVLTSTVGTIISSSKLATTDSEQSSSQLVYKITALPASGTLKFNGSPIVANTTLFTQADIAANLLTYDAPASGGSPSFNFSVTDGYVSTTGTFNITVTAAAPEIDVTGNSVSITDGDTTPSLADHTDFGSVAVGGANIVRTYTVTNTGTGTITLATATLSGAGAGQFSVGAPGLTSLGAGVSTTFTVTYTPSGSGATHAATVSFVNNDSDENPYNFDVTGTTTVPDTTPPSVTIDQAATQVDPTAGTTVKFDVVFSEAVVGFNNTKVTLTGAAATGLTSSNIAVSGTGPAYTVTVSGLTTFGDLTATIAASAVTDTALNNSLASTSTDNTVTYAAQANFVNYNTAGSTYLQNFNNYLVSTLGSVPANATSIAPTFLPSGWSFVETKANADTNIRIDNGSSGTGDTFFYGSTSSDERALGSFASGSMETQYGVKLINNSGTNLTSFTLKYNGEQWKDGGSASAIPNTLTFDYAVNPTSLTVGTYNPVTSLNYTATVSNTSSDVTLDGNANQVAVGGASGITVNGLIWNNGDSLWLRWTDINEAGNDDGLAIDDISFSAIVSPTPFVSSIAFGTPATANTTATAVSYNVTFDHAVTGVDAGDFQIVGTSSGTIGTPTTSDNITWAVPITSVTSGTLGLNLVDNDSITAAGFVLGGAGTVNGDFTGPVYNIDNTAPTVTINQSTTQLFDPTTNSTVKFDVLFSEAVTGFDNTKVTLTGAGAAGATIAVTGVGPGYTVTVSGLNTAGPVIADILAGAVTDLAGNPSAASTFTDNSITYLVPNVTLGLGDIAVTGYQATDPDKISFVLLKDISGVADFTISDNAWDASIVTHALTTGEGTSEITLNGTFLAGTQFDYDKTRTAGARWQAVTNLGASISTGITDITSGNFTLNASGDNLFVYNGGTAPTSDTDSKWVTSFSSPAYISTGTPSTSNTWLPTVFTTGINSFSLGLTGSNQNGVLTVPASPLTISGTQAAILSSVYTVGSWTTYTSSASQIPSAVKFGPTVTINQQGAVDPVPTPTIAFDVVFSSAVTNFTASDITFSGAAFTGLTVANVAVTGSGTTYTVTVSGITTPGSLTASIANSVANDAANILNFASTSTDDTVTYAPPIPAVVTVNNGSPLVYTENDPATFLDATATVTDADSSNFIGATITITNAVVGEDTLAFTNANGITGIYTPATGTLALTGTASVANYQTALQSIAYANSSENPNTTARTITFKVNDGLIDSNIATRTVNVNRVNDAPTGNVVITGAISQDSILTADTTTVVDLDGLGTFHYQWESSTDPLFISPAPTNIGTDQNTYTLTSAELGNYVRVKLTYTDLGSTAESLTSAPVGVIVAGHAPVMYTQVTSAPLVESKASLVTLTRNENITPLSPVVLTTFRVTDQDSGDTATYSIDTVNSTDAAAFDIIPGTGPQANTATLKFKATYGDFETPRDSDNNNTYDIFVIATDSAGLTSTQLVSISVQNVNEAPVFTTTDSDLRRLENFNTTLVESEARETNTVDPNADTYVLDKTTNDDPTQFNGRLEIRVRDEDNENLLGSTDAAPVIATVTQTLLFQIVLPSALNPTAGADGALFTISNATGVTIPTYDALAPYSPTLNQFGVLQFVGKFDGKDSDDPLDADGKGDFQVTVRVTDGNGGQVDKLYTIQIIKQDDNAPVFDSTTVHHTVENTTGAIDGDNNNIFDAHDDDLAWPMAAGAAANIVPYETLTYTITGGADQTKFALSGTNNSAINFNTAPDFETKASAATSNDYDLIVTVTDGHTGAASLALGSADVPQTLVISVRPNNDNSPVFNTLTETSFNGATGSTVTVNNASYTIGGGVAALRSDENQLNIATLTGSDADKNLGSATNVSRVTVATFNAGTIYTLTLGTGTSVSVTGQADRNATAAALVAAWNANITASGVYTASNLGATITFTGGSAISKGTITTSVSGTAGGTFSAVSASSSQLNYSIDATNLSGPDAKYFDIVTNDFVAGTATLTWKNKMDFETKQDANNDGVYTVVLKVADDSGETEDTGITTTDTNEGFHLLTVNVTVISQNDAPIITSNGGGATADVTVNESVGGASVLVTNVVATDQEVTAGSQVLSYSIVAGGDGSAFTINKGTGALTFKNNPDYENPTDSDHNNTYVVTVRASDSLGAKDDQVITVTVANISLVTGGIALGSRGGIELNDAASADNHYLISRDGNYLRIQDLDTSNPDSALQVSGVELLGAQSLKSDGVTVVSTLTAGNTSVSGKIVRIPYSSFDATKKPFIISTKLGNDQVDIDTTGSKLPSPSFGLTLDFGSGNDSLTLVNNATFNVWDLTSAQGGSVAVGPAGSFKFDNLENITGGSAADNFNLKMVGTESFGVLDGGAGLNTVTVSRAFGTKYTLDDALNYTDATATLGTVVGVGSLKVNPTVLTNAPKDQTWSIKNIQRANITGSNQNDTYNLDKWNQQGDNTLANNYGGLLLAGGGIDVLQKSGAMTYVGISDIEVSVTPDVTTGFAPEVQKIVIAGTPISGTYAIVTGAGTTAPIAFNANAATVQAAIRAIGGGTVFPSVTVASTGTGTNLTHTITLTGVTSDVPQFTVDNSLLVGSGTEVQRLTIAGTPTAGNYTITTPAGTTGNIPFNSNAATVQAALQLLPGYGAVTVSSSGTAPNFTHDITFTGVTGNITQLTVNSAGVTGGTFTPSTLTQGGTTTFTPSTVYQAGLHMRTAGNIQPTIVDTSAAVATTVNVTGLSRNNAKFTAAGNLDANKIALDGNWFKATLEDTKFSVNTYFPFALTGFNSSAITGAGNDQALTYKNFGWSATGTNTFDGGTGLDSIRATRDTDFTITDSSVAIGSFNASLLNNSVENFTWNTGAPTATTANTVTLSGWSGTGNANAGAGSDTLVVSKAASATNLNLNLTPQAIGVGVVGSPSFKTVGLNSSFETANITSGTGTDIITLSNWNGDATVNGTSNTTGVDTLNIQRDSGHKLETGKDTLGTGKVINYSNIDALNVTGGASANTFELLSGYDTNLTAGSANFVLKPSGGLDTLKLTSLGVSPVVTGGTTPNVVLGGRTLDLKVGGSPDLFENVAFKGAVAADTLTFTNYTGKATIDGAKSLTVNNDANYIVNAAKLTVGGSIYDIPATGAGIGADGIILVAGTSANSFTVDGWAGKLDLNAGSGTAVDALVYTSPDLSITLTDATVTSAARATAVVLNSSFETATLNGTAAASVGQNFIVTGWSNGGRISADVSPQANTKGTALDDAKNDSITIGSTSTAKDVDYVLNAGSLKYGPGTPPGSGPGTSAKTWNFTNIDQVRIDLDNVANTNKNYIDASGYTGFTYIDGGPGDDVIRGGFGVDDLNGSAGNDMLVGGEGNDKIDGDAGNDVVIGSDGIDSLDTRLNGSVGNDLVITGRTTFDNNKAALDLILAAWGSQTGGSAGAAKAALESGVGTVSGTTVKLVVGSSPTVLDDALVDIFTELATPGEDDWIFFQGNGTGDENGAGLPTDLPTNFELATDLK